MRLSQIRDFVAAVEAGSINGAARALAVSQPGITKSIRALEKDLQAQLVQRSTRGVTPTEYGRAFYLRARIAQSELRQARNRAARRQSRRLRRIRHRTDRSGADCAGSR
jgi:LysR family transcriptional regulator of abg operon